MQYTAGRKCGTHYTHICTAAVVSYVKLSQARGRNARNNVNQSSIIHTRYHIILHSRAWKHVPPLSISVHTCDTGIILLLKCFWFVTRQLSVSQPPGTTLAWVPTRPPLASSHPHRPPQNKRWPCSSITAAAVFGWQRPVDSIYLFFQRTPHQKTKKREKLSRVQQTE